MVALCVCLKKNTKAEEPKEEVAEVVEGAVIEKKADEGAVVDGADSTEVKVEVEASAEGEEKKEEEKKEEETENKEEEKAEEAAEEKPEEEAKEE